jgi:hypothetical protein
VQTSDEYQSKNICCNFHHESCRNRIAWQVKLGANRYESRTTDAFESNAHSVRHHK